MRNQAQPGTVALDVSDPDVLRLYIAACMHTSGALLTPWARLCTRANTWFAHLLNHGFERVPYFLVHDLGLLLLLGRDFPFRLLEGEATDAFSSARHTAAVAYQNRVINRVLAMPFVDEAIVLIAQDGSEDSKLLYVLERILAPLQQAPLPPLVVATASLRAVSMHGAPQPHVARRELRQHLGLGPDAPWDVLDEHVDLVVQAYDHIATDGLLGAEDLFVLHHFGALAHRADRLAMRHVAALEQQLEKTPPAPRRWQEEVPHVPIALDDIGLFPQGGLDGLATRGSMENMVQSELALIEDDTSVDLFSLRFLEGEMLYYTRDEGQLMRRMRALHVVLDLHDLHTVQYPGHPARFAAMSQAVIHSCVDELLGLFRDDSLIVRLHAFGMQRDRVAWGWRVRFAERLAHSDVHVHVYDAQPDVAELFGWRIPGRANTLLYLGGDPPPPETKRERAFRQGMALFWCQLGDLPGAPDPDSPSELLAPRRWSFQVPVAPPAVLARLGALRTALVWHAMAS